MLYDSDILGDLTFASLAMNSPFRSQFRYKIATKNQNLVQITFRTGLDQPLILRLSLAELYPNQTNYLPLYLDHQRFHLMHQLKLSWFSCPRISYPKC